ncbi:unnamed protein product [Bursaphelenchus okinawaensis]|uniref:Glutathione S-transferase n=1 Tax=Bursaphelenchus okinawaensis TaxID=465554 RepID=A0A811KAZ2_9BILA|nr:unnamed protein product [Bursaphelenchus okinawaensis]CAG9100576.1 unnamed protein product [Bursaphelenchus okinawaensis]
MVKYELRYVNLNGKAEAIRLLFEYANVSYVDKREDYLEYTKIKLDPPLPRMPYLTVDGKLEICYTSCVLEYLGDVFGLNLHTVEERALARVWGVRLNDYINELKPLYYAKLYSEQQHNLENAISTTYEKVMMQDFCVLMETQIKLNGSGFIVGKKLSWIDFYVAHFVDMNMKLVQNADYSRFPYILKHKNMFFKLPQLTNYLKNRVQEIL